VIFFPDETETQPLPKSCASLKKSDNDQSPKKEDCVS